VKRNGFEDWEIRFEVFSMALAPIALSYWIIQPSIASLNTYEEDLISLESMALRYDIGFGNNVSRFRVTVPWRVINGSFCACSIAIYGVFRTPGRRHKWQDYQRKSIRFVIFIC
jgi:hypothetical protein